MYLPKTRIALLLVMVSSIYAFHALSRDVIHLAKASVRIAYRLDRTDLEESYLTESQLRLIDESMAKGR